MKRFRYSGWLSWVSAGLLSVGLSAVAQDTVPPEKTPKPTTGDQADAVPQATTDEKPKPPEPAKVADKEAEDFAKKVRPLLMEHIKPKSALRGIALSLDDDPQSELLLTVTAIVDKETADFDGADLKKILDKEVPEGKKYEFKVDPHPVVEILTKVREKIASEESLKDAKVDDIFYIDDDDGLVAMIKGLVIDSEQSVKLVTDTSTIIKAVYGDDAPNPPKPKSALRELAAVDEESLRLAEMLQKTLTETFIKTNINRPIHGAHVYAFRDPKSEIIKFKTTVIVDQDATADLKAVQAEIDKAIMAENRLPLESLKHPVKQVHDRIRAEIVDKKINGVCVDDIYYAPVENGEWRLRLRGAYTKSEHWDVLISLANSVLKESYDENQDVKASPIEKDLELIAPDPSVEAIVKKLNDRYKKLVTESADLHGVLISTHIDPCKKDTRLDIRILVESGNIPDGAAIQNEVETTAQNEFSDKSRVSIKLEGHPVRKVLAELREFIATSEDLTGCEVTDARFELENEELSLVLKGKYLRQRQVDMLIADGGKILARHYPNKDDAPRIKTGDMSVVEIDLDVFLEKLRGRLAKNRELSGFVPSKATYETSENQKQIVIEGKAGHSGQQDAFVREASQVLESYYDSPLPFPVIVRNLKVEYLPTDELLKALQHRMETDPGNQFGSCQLSTATYTHDNGEDFLELSGRVGAQEQAESLISLANQIINETYGEAWPRAKTTQITILKPSTELSIRFFNQGLKHYTRGEYDCAEAAFAQAILEGPQRIEYKYWKVIAIIAQGRREDAYARLRPLALRRRVSPQLYGNEYIGVLKSLERVQGIHRSTLSSLETQAFVEGPVVAKTGK